jgi:glucose-1-phosphate thymidylyltransferase
MTTHLPRSIVGVIPAAGRATRLSPLPCSKELLTIGVHREPTAMRGRPKVVSEYLLEKMCAAGARRVYVVVRPGKFDIAEYYGDGSRLKLSIAYLMMGDPYGPPFSVAQAAPFLADETVVFGFPDILIQPEDALTRLVARLDATGADVVLGLFRAALDDPIDPVTFDADGRVRSLVTKEEKPPRRPGDIGYMMIAWQPPFTALLARETAALADRARTGAHGSSPDWPMGTVIAAAIRDGLHVNSVLLEDARFLDVGTPAGLAAAAAFPGVWSGLEASP